MFLHLFKQYGKAASCCAALLLAAPVIANPVHASDKAVSAASMSGPALDLSIHYYSRVMTAEGVLRESRYEETMLRRPGHVWVSRVLPSATTKDHDEHGHGAAAHSGAGVEAKGPEKTEHKELNYVVLPRHIWRDGENTRLEYINVHERDVISITPAEYENVNFDGSWVNAFFLMDPQRVTALPLSRRVSSVAGARWREQEKDGQFQRVLWDDRRLIPLVVETGDRAGRVFERVTVTPHPALSQALPWNAVRGFAKKEYSDFLD